VYVKLSINYYWVGWVGDSLRFSPSFNQILIARLVVLFPSFFLCFCLVHVDLGCPNEGGVSVDFSFLSLVCDSATIFLYGMSIDRVLFELVPRFFLEHFLYIVCFAMCIVVLSLLLLFLFIHLLLLVVSSPPVFL
jgi:hypothetical protein